MASFSDEQTALKDNGNACFAKGDFQGAEDIYTDLLNRFDKDHAILLTNRSATRLNLGRVMKHNVYITITSTS